jgi:hypothetical protein
MRTVSRRFFPLRLCVRFKSILTEMDEPDDDCVPAEELKIFHCKRVECGNCEGVSGHDSAYASEDMPELSSAVASSTIKRLGLETQR